eukprot:2708214-Pyramimonas_sp.AAC.2
MALYSVSRAPRIICSSVGSRFSVSNMANIRWKRTQARTNTRDSHPPVALLGEVVFAATQ